MKEAAFCKKLKDKRVQCQLCPHYCTINENGTGKCKARKNIGGILYSLSYEHPITVNLDPIEKKPMYNFLPGTLSFSIGMAGCNLQCQHCQNWKISQKGPEEIPVRKVKAEDIVKGALKSKCPSISYTYSEPLVSWEYVFETAKLAKKQGIKNVIVSNGFINPEPLKELCRYIDAANIDLKSIEDKFYKDTCSARIEPVLETLKILKKENVWTEITNLIIPTLNDSSKDIKKLVEWIKDNLGENSILHFTAFYPQYQLSHLKPTSPKILEKARKIAFDAGLKYVYTGNIDDEEGNITYCPKCKKMLVKRKLFSIIENNLKKGRCIYCNEKIPGVYS
jgi:pyruvate formate lyase activating enzyme